MQFDNLYLWSLFVSINLFFIVLLILFYLKREKLKKKYKLLFKGKKTFYLKYIFLFLSLFILSVNLFFLKQNKNLENISSDTDIVFTLDVSQSMNSLDYKNNGRYISRLDYSKNFIKNYILKNNNNRYSIVIFAGDAISISPLTKNKKYLLNTLKNLDYKKIPKQGSNIEEAIKLSFSRLFAEQNDNNKVMILISDGGTSPLTPLISGEGNLENDFSSFVIGVGDNKLSKIPIGLNHFGKIIYKRYNGKYVETKLNYDSLKYLANNLDGKYFYIDDFKKSIGNNINLLSNEGLRVVKFLIFVSLMFFLLYLAFNFKGNGKK